MCYDIKTNLEAQLGRANRKVDLQNKGKAGSFKPSTPEPFKDFQSSIKEQKTTIIF